VPCRRSYSIIPADIDLVYDIATRIFCDRRGEFSYNLRRGYVVWILYMPHIQTAFHRSKLLPALPRCIVSETDRIIRNELRLPDLAGYPGKLSLIAEIRRPAGDS